MDRRSLIKNAGIAGVLAAGVAPAVHAQEAVRWRLVVGHADALADGERLVDALRARLRVDEAHLGEVGPAVGAHAGPGTLVVGLQPSPS